MSTDTVHYPYQTAVDLLTGAGLSDKAAQYVVSILGEASVRALAAQAETGPAARVVTRLAGMTIPGLADLLDTVCWADVAVVREHLRLATPTRGSDPTHRG